MQNVTNTQPHQTQTSTSLPPSFNGRDVEVKKAHIKTACNYISNYLSKGILELKLKKLHTLQAETPHEIEDPLVKGLLPQLIKKANAQLQNINQDTQILHQYIDMLKTFANDGTEEIMFYTLDKLGKMLASLGLDKEVRVLSFQLFSNITSTIDTLQGHFLTARLCFYIISNSFSLDELSFFHKQELTVAEAHLKENNNFDDLHTQEATSYEKAIENYEGAENFYNQTITLFKIAFSKCYDAQSKLLQQLLPTYCTQISNKAKNLYSELILSSPPDTKLTITESILITLCQYSPNTLTKTIQNMLRQCESKCSGNALQFCQKRIQICEKFLKNTDQIYDKRISRLQELLMEIIQNADPNLIDNILRLRPFLQSLFAVNSHPKIRSIVLSILTTLARSGTLNQKNLIYQFVFQLFDAYTPREAIQKAFNNINMKPTISSQADIQNLVRYQQALRVNERYFNSFKQVFEILNILFEDPEIQWNLTVLTILKLQTINKQLLSKFASTLNF